MSVRLIPKAEPSLKQPTGTWVRWSDGQVTVRCPGCGWIMFLDHTVVDDGTVSPSLDCPNPACSFHEFVKLSGWEVAS